MREGFMGALERFGRMAREARRRLLGRGLERAIARGDSERARELLGRGADPEWRVGDSPALVAAAQGESPECARVLLEAGADPNGAGECKETALHRAALCGREECLRVLLEAGADPGISGADGDSAGWIAARYRIGGNAGSERAGARMVAMLLEAGWDWRERHPRGRRLEEEASAAARRELEEWEGRKAASALREEMERAVEGGRGAPRGGRGL